MKIAINANNKNIKSDISDIFGRCPYFIIVEIENNKIKKHTAIKNESTDQNSGAGISAAQLIAKNNVNAVISENIGPRAMDVLRQFDIEIYTAKGNIENILQQFVDKKLKKIN